MPLQGKISKEGLEIPFRLRIPFLLSDAVLAFAGLLPDRISRRNAGFAERLK